ncbi:endocuticle structural glycoprotein SgAbd-2-like isoform X3 [Ctenocephalides felis]|uniref:endocuticle structural glycoprotein SgAbd-2-like isoform X2 n=1 Tax=Ctenocephalides felis TaxID=7515 RepID=UPI000E6E17BE|nr:endocuticle structural glycoprotein SgAbd-2-like isoform X2 [Ctenocephalides felis]XP_026472346.1 endocuticle structural glycoprotein SgAbd-2-like isoform X3 [Ctenocephalides felis]
MIKTIILGCLCACVFAFPQDNERLQQQYERQQQQRETTTFIPILRFDKQQGEDGSYKTTYETGNKIYSEDAGYLKPGENNTASLVQHGQYSYTSPEGEVINVQYTADETGFHATGDHIPTPPPVPEEIQKGLDLIYEGIRLQQERAAHEAKTNPEAARLQAERQQQDYNGQYYQQ